MSTTVKYILITALRDWLFAGLFVAIFFAFGVSAFLGDTALVEENVMTVTYVAGSTRVILLIGLIVFVCFHVRRAFENREIEVMISRPISRGAFVFAYWMGFAVVAAIPILFLTIAMYFFFDVHLAGLLYWGGSLLLEAFFAVAFALFSSLILRSAVTSVLLCFGFYFLSRMMGFFTYILEKPYLFNNFDFGVAMQKVIYIVSIVIPRLDTFSKSEWLVYGIAQDTNYMIFVPQTVIYIPFLLMAAIFDFKRRQF